MRYGCPNSAFFLNTSLGSNISGSSFSRLKKVNTWQSTNYREKSLNLVLTEITDVCQKYKLPDVISVSAHIMYHRLSKCKYIKGPNKGKYIIFRGKNRKGLISACLFFSCFQNYHTMTTSDIGKMFNISSKRVTQGCKKFIKYIITPEGADCFDDTTISSPDYYIEYNCKLLKFKSKNIKLAISIANNASKLGIVASHTPQSIAAGAILRVIDLKRLYISRETVINKFKTSEVTINKVYNKLKIPEYHRFLLDDELTQFAINHRKKA
jgi:transcription initiation factor TFIIIB Brf1 subunit/transcription initiation factor TFIIB